MKKILLSILALTLCLFALTACSSDPVLDEFEKFLNEQMTEVNANYNETQALCGEWETIEDDAAFIENVDALVEKTTETKDILSKIQLTTPEVIAIKDIYESMIDKYLEAFTELRQGIEDSDAEAYGAAAEKLNEGMEILAQYNAALESLASEKGATIKY